MSAEVSATSEWHGIGIGAGVVVAMVLSGLLGTEIASCTHETGHALACIVQGDTLRHWQPFGFNPHTDSSNDENPITIAAGSIVQVLLRGLGSLFLVPWVLRRLRTDPVWFLVTAVIW